MKAAETILDELFAGSDGVSNLLIQLLGTEAAVEWRYERVWNPEKDAELEDVGRQILPVLAVSEIGAVRAGAGGTAQRGTELEVMIPAANIRHPAVPVLSRLLFRGRVWQVTEAVPQYAGSRIHLWCLKLRGV